MTKFFSGIILMVAGGILVGAVLVKYSITEDGDDSDIPPVVAEN